MVYGIVRNIRDYAIFVTDTEGCILSWNFGVEDLLGYTEDQFTGQHISTIFTPEDVARGEHLREMEKAKTQGRGENRQRWHRRRARRAAFR
jgi:PAS domain S-box-containing protein